MVMKEFLYNKVIHFNNNSLNEFQRRMVSPLPFYSTPRPQVATMWGSNSQGRWSINAGEARFFENNGTIHLLGWLRGPEYFKIHQELYDAGVIRLSKPWLIEVGKLRLNGHPNGTNASSKIFYIRLETPTKQYGKTLQLAQLLDANFDHQEYFYKYINDMTAIFQLAKQSNIKFPEPFETNCCLLDDQGLFYTVLPIFKLLPQSTVNHYMSNLQKAIPPIDSKETIIQYAREKWQPLTS